MEVCFKATNYWTSVTWWPRVATSTTPARGMVVLLQSPRTASCLCLRLSGELGKGWRLEVKERKKEGEVNPRRSYPVANRSL
jgi:hypothetical protein